jgi:hypothetical protein
VLRVVGMSAMKAIEAAGVVPAGLTRDDGG